MAEAEKKSPPPSTSTRDAVEGAIDTAKGDRNKSWEEATGKRLPKRNTDSKEKKIASEHQHEHFS
jgi:hypothetical protein